MYNFKTVLEKKWGAFKDEDTYYTKQQNIAMYSPRTFLNVLFKPVSMEHYEKVERVLHCKMPVELLGFYKSYNGIMLFSQSFRIFGVSVEDLKSSYATLDFVYENLAVRKFNPEWDDDMICFGYYGSRYRFCFHRNSGKKFYVIDRTTLETIHVFDSIAQLIEFYVKALIDEYDEHGIKIHKDPIMKEGPLRNISTEKI